MKKFIIMGAVVVLGVGTLSADDSMRSTTITKKEVAPVKFESPGPVDRELEIRVGPRVSFLTGDARVGKTGTEFDVWDDLKLDEASPGVQFDADWQPIKNWHLQIGMTWDKYDHSGATQKNISDGENTLLSGATENVNLDVYTFKGAIGYDVIKNKTYRLRPYLGGTIGLADGTASWTGTVVQSNGAIYPSNKSTTFNNVYYGTWLLGIDQRVYISRDWYVGADVGGSAWDNWYLLRGNAYTGYDFNKNWGVRLGYAADYVNWENGPKAGKAEPLLGAVYVQAVMGF